MSTRNGSNNGSTNGSNDDADSTPAGSSGDGGVPVVRRTASARLPRGSNGWHSRLAPAMPPALSTPMTSQELLKAIGDRWPRTLILASCAALLVVLAVWQFWPQPAYTARAYLYVSAVPPKVMFATAENRADFGTYQRRQIALIKSRLVLNTALRDPRVAALPRLQTLNSPTDWLEGELRVDDGYSPEFLRISMDGDEPEELGLIVNAVTDAYLREVVNKEHNERLEHLDRLRRLRTEYENNLRRKRDSQRRLAEDAGSSDSHTLVLRQRLASEQLAQTQKALLETRLELRRLEADVTATQSRHDALRETAIDAKQLEEAVDNDPVAKELAGRVLAVEAKLRQVRDSYMEGYEPPAAARLAEELERLKAAQAKQRETLRASIVAKARQETQGESQAALAHATHRVALMQELERSLNADISRLNQEVRSMNLSSLDLDQLNRDIAQAELTTNMVAQEVERMNVELQAPARVSRLEEAAVSRPNDLRRRAFVCLIAGVGVFGLVWLGMAWREFHHRRVQSGDQLAQGLGMRVVGTIPYVRNAARNGGSAGGAQVLSESINAVRTMLLRAAKAGDLRSVMVTSAVGGEGKTSLACHLAASLARAGKKTLLLDADLRSPKVHACFELRLAPGFAEILNGKAEALSCIQAASVDGLFILTSGRADAASLRALARENLAELLKTLKEHYDFVVVDSCPVLPVADSLQVGQHVDAAVLSILRDVSRLPAVYSAWQQLSALGIRVLGAVVSGAKRPTYGRAYPKHAVVADG